MSLLIVDDSFIMRRTIRRVVGAFADDIIKCDDGAKALATDRKHLPDRVLMDVEMREKDGLTATGEICAAFANAKIVIVTNHGDAAMRAAAEQAATSSTARRERMAAEFIFSAAI